MNFYLIRHGECLGQSDVSYYQDPDSPLSSLGKQQAQLIDDYFSQIELAKLISSPLVRALETAMPLSKSHNLPIGVWIDLREGCSASHQGRTLSELQSTFPTAVFPSDITKSGWTHGNDLYADWLPRCKRVLERLVSMPKECSIAVISHGGFVNYLLHYVLDLSFDRPGWFELENGSVSKLRFVPNPEEERPNWPLYPPVRVEVHFINSTRHL